MAPYHILIVIISSVIPENSVLLTKSEQSGPKSAHIRPTFLKAQFKYVVAEFAVTKLVNVFDACSLWILKKFQLVITTAKIGVV